VVLKVVLVAGGLFVAGVIVGVVGFLLMLSLSLYR
jgi:hypothetical protein